MQRNSTSGKGSQPAKAEASTRNGSKAATPEALTLEPRQQKALNALVAGQTKTEAAKVAKVDRGTIYAWLEDPMFVAELNRIRSELAAAAAEELRSLSVLAVSTVRRILESEHESSAVKLRAAFAVLEKVPLKLRPIGATTVEGVIRECEEYEKELAQFERYMAILDPVPDSRPIKPL